MNKQNSHDFNYRISFFRKKLIPQLFIIIAAFSLINIITCSIVKNNIRQRLNEDSEKLLSQSMYTFNSIINEIYTLALLLTYDSPTADTIRACLQKPYFIYSDVENIKSIIITPVIATREYIESIYIYFENDNDYFFANNEGIRSLKNYSDNEWVQDIYSSENQNKTIWSEQRTYNKIADLNLNQTVVSLYQRNLYRDGIVVLNLNCDYLNNLLDSMISYTGQVIYVLNEKSEIVFSSSDNPFINHLNASAYSPDMSQPNEKIYYVTRQQSDFVPSWTIVSAIPYQSLYAPISRINLFILITIIFVCIVTSVIMLQQVKKSYNSITRIMNFINDIKENPELPPTIQQSKEYEFIVESVIESSIRESELKQQLLQKQYQNKVLELKSLQAQINPHFLLNTLQSIFWASFQLTGNYNPVSEMIENLNTILGYLLKSNDTLVSIEDEIRVLKSYVSIFKARHNHSFLVSWDIPEADYSNCYIGKMILQPFIENAISHGFIGNHRSDYHITCSLRKSNKDILIIIKDNGVGIAKETLEKIKRSCHPTAETPTSHIGIYNSNRRLYLIYGNTYTINFDSTPQTGTTVTLSLPLITQENYNSYIPKTNQ